MRLKLHTLILLAVTMAQTNDFKIVERLAELCLAINFFVRTDYHSHYLKTAYIYKDGSIDLQLADQTLDRFDRGDVLSSQKAEQKHVDAALMYRSCSSTITLLKSFVTEALKSAIS